MQPHQARTRLAYLRMVMGIMWVAPGFGAKLLGLDPQEQSSVKVMGRLFAVRDLALGATLLKAEGAEADRQIDYGIAVDAADLAAIIMAASRKEVGARTLLLGGGVAAAALAMGIIARGDD